MVAAGFLPKQGRFNGKQCRVQHYFNFQGFPPLAVAFPNIIYLNGIKLFFLQGLDDIQGLCEPFFVS